jgi:threonine dehydrogenase-like Zn-dependent dehydrogenase
MRRGSILGASVPLYAAQIARALVPEADVLVVEARAEVRKQAARLGFETCEPKAIGRRQAPLVLDSSADPRGLTTALQATAPDGICSCAGTLHASVKIPAARMFGRNSTLTAACSHIRTVIPEVLDLVAARRIHPESVTTTIASFEDAPKVLSDHLRGAATKTILVRTP